MREAGRKQWNYEHKADRTLSGKAKQNPWSFALLFKALVYSTTPWPCPLFLWQLAATSWIGKIKMEDNVKFSPVLKSLLINHFILSQEVVGKGLCFGEGECGEKQSCEKSVPGIIFSTIAINTQNRSWWGLHWRATSLKLEGFRGRVFQNRKEGFWIFSSQGDSLGRDLFPCRKS